MIEAKAVRGGKSSKRDQRLPWRNDALEGQPTDDAEDEAYRNLELNHLDIR